MFEIRSRKPHRVLSTVVSVFTERRGFLRDISVVRPLHAKPQQFDPIRGSAMKR
jgi:hypothetical protein